MKNEFLDSLSDDNTSSSERLSHSTSNIGIRGWNKQRLSYVAKLGNIIGAYVVIHRYMRADYKKQDWWWFGSILVLTSVSTLLGIFLLFPDLNHDSVNIFIIAFPVVTGIIAGIHKKMDYSGSIAEVDKYIEDFTKLFTWCKSEIEKDPDHRTIYDTFISKFNKYNDRAFNLAPIVRDKYLRKYLAEYAEDTTLTFRDLQHVQSVEIGELKTTIPDIEQGLKSAPRLKRQPTKISVGELKKRLQKKDMEKVFKMRSRRQTIVKQKESSDGSTTHYDAMRKAELERFMINLK